MEILVIRNFNIVVILLFAFLLTHSTFANDNFKVSTFTLNSIVLPNNVPAEKIMATGDGKYIGVLNTDNKFAIYKVSKSFTLKKIYDSTVTKKVVWSFTCNNDKFIICATNGYATYEEARKAPENHHIEHDDIFMWKMGDMAKVYQIKIPALSEIIVDKFYSSNIMLSTDGKLLSVFDKYIFKKEPIWVRGILIQNMVDKKKLSILKDKNQMWNWGFYQLCWKNNDNGIIAISERLKNNTQGTSGNPDLPYTYQILLDFDIKGNLKKEILDVANPESAVIVDDGKYLSYFVVNKGGSKEIKVHFYPLTNLQHKELILKPVMSPNDFLNNVAILPNKSGIIFQCFTETKDKTKSNKLYFYPYNSASPIEIMKDVKVEKVYGNCGKNGILLCVSDSKNLESTKRIVLINVEKK